MLSWLAAAAAGALAGFVQYGGRRGASAGGGSGRLAALALLRAAAIALLVALLLDAPLGARGAPEAFAALDVSASWRRGGDSAAYSSAVRQLLAARTDSLFLVGDSVRAGPPPATPSDGASRVRPAVERALAAGRPLLLVTDGAVDDPAALGELPAGSEVRVVAPAQRPDLALVGVEAPRAAVRGDTIEVRLSLAAGGAGAAARDVTLSLGGRPAARLALAPMAPWEERTMAERLPVAVADGATLLEATIDRGDAEPRNDSLAVPIEISPAAGAVLVSTSPDLDSRYATAVLRGALALPTRAYLRVAPGVWRVEGTLAPVAESEVRAAVRTAPLVVLHGDTAIFGAPRALGRGSLALVVPQHAGEEDFYAVGAPPSPLAGALAALPWDSLPPIDVSPAPPRGEWEGLETRRGRRGERRVAVAGSERPRRVVVVAASGFGRWAFRAGVAADAFATLWGSVFDWLAAERSDVRAALPAEGVVRAGESVRWRRGSGSDSLVVVRLRRRGAPARDDSVTLDFRGGATIADSPPLDAGVYDVRVAGGAVLLAVNASREWLPRKATVRSGAVGGRVAAGLGRGARSNAWLYALVLAGLCVEWVLRRRAGMR